MTQEAMRLEFEAWAIEQRDQNHLPYFIFARKPDGAYTDSSAEHAWKGWQAAMSANPSVAKGSKS